MKLTCYLMLGLLFFVISCDQQSCNSWRQIASTIKDTDADGWLDTTNNQKIDLIIDKLDFPVQSQFTTISLVVDDQIILDNISASPSINISPEVIATSRYAGIWWIGHVLEFRARVKVFSGITTDASEFQWLPFVNKDSTYTSTLTINSKDVTFHYRTRITKFADPSPQDSSADLDKDGIHDAEEAELAHENNRMGDPLKRDILVCTGFTAPKWALTKRSIERITTVFLKRGFNFLLADETADMPGITPGQVLLPDGANGALIAPSEDRAVMVNEVPAVRSRHIISRFNSFTHMLIAADHTPDADFGISNSIPGRNVVIRSQFFMLGPDPFGLEYQAKDAMHELGHNLGLCHPNESDSNCPTGAIPQSERNGAASCMGSPADDGGLFNGIVPNVTAITNAFSRPLDYSPTQWTNIDPGSSRNK